MSEHISTKALLVASVLQVNDLVNLVQAIAAITTKPDPLSHHRALEEAVKNDWILTTGEIERLLG